MMKHEWRKHEKQLYLPKATPEFIDVPNFRFLTISGAGNPNAPEFPEYIQALYAACYAIKMTLKKAAGTPPTPDYTVYPLEGIWDINDEAKKRGAKTLNKDELIFKLMIRQPDFVAREFALEMIDNAKATKKLPRLDHLKFEKIHEGPCVQMLHIGSYDNEPESFAQMEQFAQSHNAIRREKTHREIYLSDFRKTAPEKLKTVLRFQVKQD